MTQPPLTQPLAWLKWVFTASHRGRVGRLAYLGNRVAIMATGFGLGLLLALLGSAESLLLPILAAVIAVPAYVTLFWRSVTLDVQRLHDLNLAGWWLVPVIVLGFVPGVNVIVMVVYYLVALLVPGTAGANRFSVHPLRAVPPLEEGLPVEPAPTFAAALPVATPARRGPAKGSQKAKPKAKAKPGAKAKPKAAARRAPAKSTKKSR